MSPNALASKLLQFSSTTSLMVPGALIAEIGHDALREALNLGWLRPSSDTGLLMLTDEQTQLHEMRALAAAPEAAAPAPQVKSASRGFAMGHSGRLREWFGTGLDNGQSGGAPGSGQPQRGVAQMTTPPSQFAKPGQDYAVGEDVMIADEGKSYQAKVQSKNPDGTYKLSFGPNRPVKQDRMFRREEMQRITQQKPGEVKVQS